MNQILVYKILEKFQSCFNTYPHFPQLNEACPSSNMILKFLFLKYKMKNTKMDDLNILGQLLTRLYELINTPDWKDVCLSIRYAITFTSFLKFIIFLDVHAAHFGEDHLLESYKIIDYGIIFGGPLCNRPSLLQECAHLLQSSFNHLLVYESLPSDMFAADLSSPREVETIDIVCSPSLEQFNSHYLQTSKPVKILNQMKNWSALEKWQDPNYLLIKACPRHVPVEYGSYKAPVFRQDVQMFKNFMRALAVTHDTPNLSYMAQYAIFEHIPDMKEDICIPDYCSLSEKEIDVDINGWFGPKNTISPLHNDPKNNFLCQVVGVKTVVLYSPEDSQYLYPFQDSVMSNTSQVDVEKPDHQNFPLFVRAQPIHCTLNPGEMLYIPPGWWHHVHARSASISVSFWWV